MNIFIDTEFTNFIDTDLISIALVAEDGREFYGERNDFDSATISDFVRAAVLPQLRASGALVLSKSDLLTAVTDWLAPYEFCDATVCFDYSVDRTLLYDLFDNAPPPWLKTRNINGFVDLEAYERFFVVEALSHHHALHDARANRFAMQHNQET
jgi:hypothetical protein